MQQADLAVLAHAAQQLESSSIATSISHIIGMPIEKAMSALPGHWSNCWSGLVALLKGHLELQH